jgi:hypothetical protein
MPSVQKASNVLEEAAVDAAGAFLDGRGKNIVFKHKQLIKLFGKSCLERVRTEADKSRRLPKKQQRNTPRIPREWIPGISSKAHRRVDHRAEAGISRH